MSKDKFFKDYETKHGTLQKINEDVMYCKATGETLRFTTTQEMAESMLRMMVACSESKYKTTIKKHNDNYILVTTGLSWGEA